ncbi:2,3-bisphosphoglycerate-independent phosphoglycerate mutase [Spironucleus salmonicida]|uniref:2,3-bisphosphoglycerate-independent phosphoglycerate mutase n=1 Tax=Spironucleus salmonicida TaxID=348837 RepID=V6LSF4_9EUKA|nr:2,3-bisphosphoglycerate-independent phosphoglycerate mutase [Spironucleus salmonicida]|eukprot:EST43689.1 2,3-bisphosphoglycerate-independent phosphoglycerate mutase [Spironucleus salmonicida]
MKLFFILDGLGDTARPSPLKQAQTHYFDKYQQKCNLFKFQAVLGQVPTSDEAFASFLDLQIPKRGVLEALGDGHNISAGQTAFKCIFASQSDNTITNRHPHISNENGLQLVNEISNIDNIKIIHQNQHRFSIVCDDFTEYENDPLIDGQKIKETQDQRLLLIQNKIDNILQKSSIAIQHKINTVLFRAPGQFQPQLIKNTKYIFFTDSQVIYGIALSLNCDVFYWHKINFLELLHQYENRTVIFHFDNTDKASHQGNIALKIKEIETADKIFGKIMDEVKVEQFCIFGDHATPCKDKVHSSDFVPLMISGGSGCLFSDEDCLFEKLVCGREILDKMDV